MFVYRLALETNKKILLIEAGKDGTGQSAVGGKDYVASVFANDPATGNNYVIITWSIIFFFTFFWYYPLTCQKVINISLRDILRDIESNSYRSIFNLKKT